MRKNWPYIVNRIIKEEVRPGHEQDGDLHTDPNDPGGTTKFGFAQKYNKDIDVSSLTRLQAENRYFLKYWGPIAGDKLPTGADLIVMNFAVNAGIVRAVSFQEEATLFADDAAYAGQDIIGSPLWIEFFIDKFTELVKVFYKNRPQKLKILYLKDWLYRTERIAKYARLMLMSEMTGKSVEELNKTKSAPDIKEK